MLNANDSTSNLAPFVNDAAFSGDPGIALDKPLTFENETTTATTYNYNNNLVNGLADLDSFDLNLEQSESLAVDVTEAAGNMSKKNGKKRKKGEAAEAVVGDSPSDMGDAKKKKKQTKSANQRRNIKKVLGEEKLNEATVRALNEEKERQERLNNLNSTNQPAFNFNMAPNMAPPQNQYYHHQQQQQQPIDFNSFLAPTNLDPMSLSTGSSSFSSSSAIPVSCDGNKLAKLDMSGNTSSDQSVCIIEDEDEGVPKQEKRAVPEIELDESEVIELEDEEDDCMILSESERLQEDQAAAKKLTRGIHMNDELNRADANGQVLVNVNHPGEDPDVCLLPYLAKSAKTHQIGGIRFMYDNIVESLSRIRIRNTGFGCILAHAMGLGKTFQVISFIEVFLRATCAKRVLCIVPINTIQNWQSEFNNWLPENGQQRLDKETVVNYQRPFKVSMINDFAKTLKQRTEIILDWKNRGGVLLIGYEMFRTLIQNSKTAKQMKNQKKLDFEGKVTEVIDIEEENPELANMNELQTALLTPCLVVCDEGHRIKNNMANIAKTLQKIVTKRRIVLTGYPLQNNLTEYWCMVDFVRPSYLGTKAEFSNMFERPIMNGQCMDSTREDVKLMRYRSHVLHSLLEGFVQRRGHDVFYGQLTQKQEYIILLKMSPVQKQLYLGFMEAIGAMNSGEKSNPLRSFAICCKIWNHPDVLYKYHTDKASDIDLDLPDFPVKKTIKSAQQQQLQTSRSSPSLYSDDSCSAGGGFNPFGAHREDQRSKAGFDPDWADQLMEQYQPGLLENGAKFLISIDLIQQSVIAGDKILLFSQSLLSLDLFEKFLSEIQMHNSSENWTKNRHYYRLDGSTSGVERERLINAFNKPTSTAWLFLLSTRAGCLGINLVGANRVIVLDASWNPCHDAQAVCRVYRYGQKKTSYIYRLVADHTMEKKIYDRQVSKQSMSDRVVDQIQAENHFTRTEVEKLIHFVKEDVPAADLRHMPQKFDDQVLINSCMKCAHVITREPFTHESLLLDKREYQLSEREKNMAFRDYNHEKKYFPTSKPTYSQFYQRAQAAFPHHSSHPYSQLYPAPPQINPNINYSALVSYNNSNNSNPQPQPLPSNILNHRAFTPTTTIANKDNKTDLDFNLHTSSPQKNSSINSPAILKCLNSKPDFSIQQQHQLLQQHSQPQQSLPVQQQPQNLRDVKITRVTVPTRLVIPASLSDQSSSPLKQAQPTTQPLLDGSVVIQPGQQVYLLTSAKGTFLRTPDKKYVAITDQIRNEIFSSINNTGNNMNITENNGYKQQQQQNQQIDGYQQLQQQQSQFNGYQQNYGYQQQVNYQQQSYNQSSANVVQEQYANDSTSIGSGNGFVNNLNPNGYNGNRSGPSELVNLDLVNSGNGVVGYEAELNGASSHMASNN